MLCAAAGDLFFAYMLSAAQRELGTEAIYMWGGAFTKIGGNLPLYIALFTDRILPVELTSFTAKAVKYSVQLTWQTAAEVMNCSFEIERKQLQGNWSRMGFIEGAVNSNAPKSYSYIYKRVFRGAL